MASQIKRDSDSWLKIAQLRAEKCELKEAGVAFSFALAEAKKSSDYKTVMEAIAGLLRLSAEALDGESIQKWDKELDRFMKAHPHQIPAMAWYCRGAVARHQSKPMLAQRHFHRYLRSVRLEFKSKADLESEEKIARGWVMLATTLKQRGRYRRSMWLAKEILKKYEKFNFRGVNGTLYLLLGGLFEQQKDYSVAMRWIQSAHSQFLGEHNWYCHLYVLYGYARIARHQKTYSHARWLLDMVDKACASPEFGSLRREITIERSRLEKEAIDLLIDAQRGLVKTREKEQISLKKQFVLLHILEALLNAHGKNKNGMKLGLSKAEIIEYVWREPYQSDVHDNKLYYNINRLRKLIEPNVHKPRYLLNWKEGYRLAPSLRIHYVSE